MLVQRSIYDEFVEEMKKFIAEKYVAGDTFDFNSNLDPLISKSHAAKVWSYIEKGKEEGARLVCGGEHYTDPVLAKGNYTSANKTGEKRKRRGDEKIPAPLLF